MRLDLPIRTARLELRLLTPADLPAMHALAVDPAVVRALFYDPPTEDESRQALQGHLDRDPAIGLVLAVETQAGRFVGRVNLAVTPEHQQGEVGFIIAPAEQGKGYATEAAQAMLALGFDTYGLHRIMGRVEARNVASTRVLEKLGMRREAHLVENGWINGEWQSELIYALLDREFAARAAPPSASAG